MVTWHEKTFASAEELRRLADREERLAAAAIVDGDRHHAEIHRNNASQYREQARLKEVS